MGPNFFNNYYDVAAVILFGIGITSLILHRNLVKKVIGINIAVTAVYLFLAAKGYVAGRIAPIIVDGVQDVAVYVNPIPAGLILTGIVITVSVNAFALALIVKLYTQYKTIDLDEIMKQVSWEEED